MIVTIGALIMVAVRPPDRIPLILGALERRWRQEPDSRLGQLIVNLVRNERCVPPEDEERVLFNVEDGELLSWLGPEGEKEVRYVEEEPQQRREGWQTDPK